MYFVEFFVDFQFNYIAAFTFVRIKTPLGQCVSQRRKQVIIRRYQVRLRQVTGVCLIWRRIVIEKNKSVLPPFITGCFYVIESLKSLFLACGQARAIRSFTFEINKNTHFSKQKFCVFLVLLLALSVHAAPIF